MVETPEQRSYVAGSQFLSDFVYWADDEARFVAYDDIPGWYTYYNAGVWYIGHQDV